MPRAPLWSWPRAPGPLTSFSQRRENDANTSSAPGCRGSHPPVDYRARSKRSRGPGGTVIGGLSVLPTILDAADPEAGKAALVAFLEPLTDERVRRAAAPFDHPQNFVPNGHPGDSSSVVQLNGRAVDTFLEIPATGRNGGPILPGFLEDD